MRKLVRLAGMSVMALSLTTGVAAASSGSIYKTGPDSTNRIEYRNRNNVNATNENRVGVANASLQLARTGNARATHNTDAGSARSGDAANDNLSRTTVRVNNSGSSVAALRNNNSNNNDDGSIDTTGPDSTNVIRFQNHNNTNVTNTNEVGVLNLSVQAAQSGNAKVHDNTEGGSATSGNASNVNTSETTIEITN